MQSYTKRIPKYKPYRYIILIIKHGGRERMQREAKKQMQETGIGTKSQQALKLQQEQNKQERKVRSREKKEADELRMFELKQQNCGYRWVL
nr:YjdF family protein [Lachnospira eligens]